MMEDFVKFNVACGASGVYLLLRREEVIYAGQSLNVFARIATHLNTMKRALRGKKPYSSSSYAVTKPEPIIFFDSVRVKLCLEQDLDREEFALIQQFRPKHNRLMNRPPNPAEQKVRALPGYQEILRRAGLRQEAASGPRRRRVA